MPHSSHGLHHFHKRKRISRGEPYPHPDKLKRLVDRLIYFIVFIGPVMTIPQVFDIWIKKNATGVSILSWAAYLFVSVFWLLYGIIHREKPIIVSSLVWVLLEVLIVAGLLIY